MGGENVAGISMKEFAAIVRNVIETLPEAFHEHMDNVVVDVGKRPSHKLLLRAGFTEGEIEAGDSLLGLFDPLELPSPWSGDTIDTDSMMHRLWVFRDTHVEEFPDPKRLRIEIRKTVVHELAHHFGWTDRDLEKFDDNPNPFGEV